MNRVSPRRRPLATALVLTLVTASCGGGSSSPSGRPAVEGKVRLAAATLDGSGSTFQKGYDDEAIANFRDQQPAVTVNYAGGGSGQGQTDLQGRLVDFACSDNLPKPEDRSKYKGGALLYFPTVAAPITLSYDLPGLSKLQLSAATIAKIFQRQIKRWDDAGIVADNPGTELPATSITVVHRSDGSGTTAQFTKYLVAAAGPAWSLGSDKTVAWPADTQAGNGNGGVAQLVKGTPGAIGYVDLSDAKAAGLVLASVKNKAGKYVAPTTAAASAALAGAVVDPDLSYDPLDAPGESAYPITAPSYVLVYRNQTDRAKGAALKAFLTYILTDGQELAEAVDFARLSEGLRKQAIAQLDQLVIPSR